MQIFVVKTKASLTTPVSVSLHIDRNLNGCIFVFYKTVQNTCIFYWTRKARLKQGVDKVYKHQFFNQVEVVKMDISIIKEFRVVTK